jgi:hypothetical protein
MNIEKGPQKSSGEEERLKQLRAELAPIIEKYYQEEELSEALSKIKHLSDKYGREIGGDIEEYEDDQGRKYIRLTNISLGEEYQVIRGGEGSVKFNTHPIKLEELEKRLRERTHFDMPSHADFLNFCIDNRRRKEIILGNFYKIILEKPEQPSVYLQTLEECGNLTRENAGAIYNKFLSFFLMRGPHAFIDIFDFFFINSWERRFNKRYDMENWIEFARKAGLKVTIEEIDIKDLSEDLQQCKQMISQYNTINVFEPIEDEEFNQWVNETKQDFIKMIQDSTKEKIERKQETKSEEKIFAEEEIEEAKQLRLDTLIDQLRLRIFRGSPAHPEYEEVIDIYEELVKRGYQTEADVIQAILNGEIDKELLERMKRTEKQTKVKLSSRILRAIAEKYE